MKKNQSIDNNKNEFCGITKSPLRYFVKSFKNVFKVERQRDGVLLEINPIL